MTKTYVDPLTGTTQAILARTSDRGTAHRSDIPEEVRRALAKLRLHLPPSLNRLDDEKLLCLVEWTIKVARDMSRSKPMKPSRAAADKSLDLDGVPF